MTEKPIMINGIDISKCKYFDYHYKECKAEYYTRYGYEIVKFNSCKDNPNCYFKQLVQTEHKLDKIKKVCHKFTPDHYKILLIINDGTVEEE